MQIDKKHILEMREEIQNDLDCLLDSGYFTDDSERDKITTLACQIVVDAVTKLLSQAE